MNGAIRIAPLLLLVALVGQLSHADDKDTQQIKGWGRVVDPASDCAVTEKDGKVTITVPGTHHDLNPSPNFNVLAPRVLQEVEGDFVAQVKVDAFTRPQAKTASSKAGISFVAGGLVVWQDERNFLRLLRAANGERGDLFGHLEIYRDGLFVGGGYAQGIADQATHLKVVRKGDAFSFAVSVDGKEWTEIEVRGSNIGKLDLSKKLMVGVAATNATSKEFAARFEGLSVAVK
jgi:hypothetical protein